MKKRWGKPLFLPVILVIIYIVGMALGAYIISAYPVYRQKEYFRSQARTIAQEYLAGTDETLTRMSNFNTQILIYDAEGNCLRQMTADNSRFGPGPGVPLEKYIPSVLAGREICRPTLARASQRDLSDIIIVAGAPIQEQGSVIGAVFLIKNLMDLPEAVLGYICYFTVFYWVTVYFIVSNTRKNKKLEQLRQNYIANVTHAFKTPIASIKALAETLCDGVEPDPDQQKVYYGMILREANRQDRMVRDVLELAKLQSSGMDFSKTSIRACAIFEPVIEKYATLCDCMDVSLHVSEKISCLPPLYTNAACIKQLLEILLDNALKFVKEGGDIWVDAACARNKATICVRDNGIGISKEALPHVFERFFKGSHAFNESGSGLGLAIAQEIVSGLKEKIWVESEQGQGAAFFLTIHLK